MNDNKKLQDQIKELVIQRILATSTDSGLAIGLKDYTSQELIEHIKQDDQIGKQVVDIQINYLRDLVQGKIYAELENYTTD